MNLTEPEVKPFMNLTHQVWFVSKSSTLGFKPSIGNTFAPAARFFVQFFAVAARPPRETASFHVLWRTWTRENDFIFLSFFQLRYSLFEFNSRKVRQHLTIERDGIRRKKFETGCIHFSRDVFSAVVAVDAWGTVCKEVGNPWWVA